MVRDGERDGGVARRVGWDAGGVVSWMTGRECPVTAADCVPDAAEGLADAVMTLSGIGGIFGEADFATAWLVVLGWRVVAAFLRRCPRHGGAEGIAVSFRGLGLHFQRLGPLAGKERRQPVLALGLRHHDLSMVVDDDLVPE